MSHNINKMVYAGEVPWHGLGTALPENADWETIREAAGFYRAVKRPLFVHDDVMGHQKVPDAVAVVREDTGAYLSTVGNRYEIMQFEDLAEAGVKAAGDFKAVWHTAGTLGPNGIRGWLLGELPNPIRINGDTSLTRKYILLTGAHTGLNASEMMDAMTRVVCENTFKVALSEQHVSHWKIRHSANAKARLMDAAAAFASMVKFYAMFEDIGNQLVKIPYSEKFHKEAVDALLPIPEDDKNHTNLLSKRETVLSMFETFTGSEGLKGTAWGAYQAWTEFADHKRTQRDTDGRMNSSLFGSGAKLKRDALSTIMAQVEAVGNKVLIPA